jgi:PAS domain S-box-containing protein
MNFIKAKTEARIAIFYAIFGGLWIIFSDALLDVLIADRALYTRLQTYKGWFFVAASALLIYSLIKQENDKQAAIAERLRASEEGLRRFELLTEHSRDIILFMRREDGSILDANTAAVKTYGYSYNDLLALTVQDLRAPDTQGLTPSQMEQADAGGILFETVHRRKDGSTFPVEVSSQGATIGGARTLVSVVRDITERKRVEQERRESEQRFNIVYNKIPFAAVLSKQDGVILDVNQAFERVFGYTKDEVLGKTSLEVGINVDLESRERIISELRSRGCAYDVELKLFTKSRDVRVFLVNLDIVDIRGEKLILQTAQDITERKYAEEKVVYQAALLSNVNDAVIASDAQFNLTAWNAAAESLYGWKAEEVIGRNGLEIVQTEWPEMDAKEMRRTIAETGRWLGEATQARRDGTRFPVEVSSIVLYDASGQVSGYISVNRDITERKRADEELHRTMHELRRSNAELEQFAYVASHDLQEPLRGIAGLAQLLQQRYQGQLDSQSDEFIGLIVEGTQRMQTLINDLLAYSRIGRRGETIQLIEVETALNATLKNLNAAIQEYEATITNDSLPKVRADATQLIQLFQNLIGNAIKFRANRPPQIHIGVSEAGDFWQFSVQDNGIGIEPQYFERIFQVFQRLHTRQEYKGTGIGLAICKKIIERNGGQIWVESEFGRGSTFYFTLPKGA